VKHPTHTGCGGPLTNEETDMRDPDAVICAACGKVIEVSSELLAVIRKADSDLRQRMDKDGRP